MNQNSTSSRFVVAMVAALIVVACTWMVRHPSDATRITGLRTPDSMIHADDAKSARIRDGEDRRPQGKASGSFQVVIAADAAYAPGVATASAPSSATAAAAATPLKLRGIITAERHIAPHDFAWILPTGYRVLSGSVTGLVPELRPGQIHEVSILVEPPATPTQPLVLHVFKLVNNEPRGQIAQLDLSSNVKAMGAAEASAANAQPSAPLKDQNYVQ